MSSEQYSDGVRTFHVVRGPEDDPGLPREVRLTHAYALQLQFDVIGGVRPQAEHLWTPMREASEGSESAYSRATFETTSNSFIIRHYSKENSQQFVDKMELIRREDIPVRARPRLPGSDADWCVQFGESSLFMPTKFSSDLTSFTKELVRHWGILPAVVQQRYELPQDPNITLD